MPAITVAQAADALGEYVRDDANFLRMLNMVMPRIYAMGFWRDLLETETITTDLDYVPLPDGYESVLNATYDNAPASLHAMWEDYAVRGSSGGEASNFFGLVDAGYHAVMIDPNFQSGTWSIRLADGVAASGDLQFRYIDTSDQPQILDFALTGSTAEEIIGSATTATLDRITQLAYTNVYNNADNTPVRIVADNGTEEYSLAYGRGSQIKRYRRFRIPPTTKVTPVTMLLKRAWQPVLDSSDLMYLGNLNAIKHGILGTIAEDNGDPQRATYHWNECRRMLDEELDAHRGGAKPRMKPDPFSGSSRIPNLM